MGTCSTRVRTSLLGANNDIPSAINRLATSIARCQWSTTIAEKIRAFKVLDLEFSDLSKASLQRVCLKGHEDICVIGPSVDANGHVDFSNARLDDHGRLAELLQKNLTELTPGNVTIQSLSLNADGKKGRLSVRVQLIIAGLPPIAFDLNDESIASTTREVLQANLEKQLSSNLDGATLLLGGVQLKITHVKTVYPRLSVGVLMTFHGGIDVPLVVDLFPDLKVRVEQRIVIAKELANLAAFVTEKERKMPKSSSVPI